MQVLEECSKIICSHNINTEIISLYRKKILACIACYECEKHHKCALDDELNGMVEKIRKVDGLIVGSPVYFGTARGDLLNLLQRIGMIHLSDDNFLFGKVGGPIAISRHSGLEHTLEDMMTFFRICDIVVPNSAYNNMIIGRNPGEALKDKQGMKNVRKFSEDLAQLIISQSLKQKRI